jgi:hypothetical protein
MVGNVTALASQLKASLPTAFPELPNGSGQRTGAIRLQHGIEASSPGSLRRDS